MLPSSIPTLTNLFLTKFDKYRFAGIVAGLPPSCDHSFLSNGAIEEGSILHRHYGTSNPVSYTAFADFE